MRWLIGYSACPLTRGELEARGHEVWTCDLLPARDGSARHFQCDIWEIARDRWDRAIFHPMCTYLTVSAAWAFNDPDFDKYPSVGYHQRVKPETLVGADRRAAREAAIENFLKLLELPYPKAIENPARSFLSSSLRPADQIVQPYEFGDDASKATGLWLDRLPPLRIDPAKRRGGANGWRRRALEQSDGQRAKQADAGRRPLAPAERNLSGYRHRVCRELGLI